MRLLPLTLLLFLLSGCGSVMKDNPELYALLELQERARLKQAEVQAEQLRYAQIEAKAQENQRLSLIQSLAAGVENDGQRSLLAAMVMMQSPQASLVTPQQACCQVRQEPDRLGQLLAYDAQIRQSQTQAFTSVMTPLISGGLMIGNAAVIGSMLNRNSLYHLDYARHQQVTQADSLNTAFGNFLPNGVSPFPPGTGVTDLVIAPTVIDVAE